MSGGKRKGRGTSKEKTKSGLPDAQWKGAFSNTWEKKKTL